MEHRKQGVRDGERKNGEIYARTAGFNVNKSNAAESSWQFALAANGRRVFIFMKADVYWMLPALARFSDGTSFPCLVRVNLLSEAREQ